MKNAALCSIAVAVAIGGVGLWANRIAHPPTPLYAPREVLPVPPTVVGMNVSPLAYWTGERPFVDPIQSNAQFAIQFAGGTMVALIDQVPLDRNGWPMSVPTNATLWVSVQEFDPQQTGRFDCRVSPGWSLTGVGDADVAQNKTRFRLTIRNGPTHNSKISLRPQHGSAVLTALFCAPLDPGPADGSYVAAFLDDLRPFRVIRFMNWMRANKNPPNRWALRPSLQARSQAEPGGVALEHMVDLARRLNADPWFTVPLDADDEYHRTFAVYVRDHLPRNRRAYVEVSNEVWNGAFAQSKLATKLGRARYPTASAIEATDYYYADRVRGVMAIWRTVFGAELKSRVVRVLASQAANAQRADNALRHGETWRSVDALAIAPYFGETVQAIESTGPTRLRELNARGPEYIDKAIATAHANKAVAARFGLPLIAYEAGPDFAGYNPVAVADARAWHQSHELAALYREYLDRWRSEIGGLIVVYDSAGKDGYGHKLYTGQPIADAPLMRTVVDFAYTTENRTRRADRRVGSASHRSDRFIGR